MLESGLMSLLTKKPIILTYQCDMALSGSLVNRISVLFVRLSGWISLWKARRVIVLSKDYALSSVMLKRYLNKVVEISPPNRFESFIYEVEDATSFIDDKIVIGFVGRFAREKGLDCLLKAMNNLVNENVYLYLAGDYQNIRGGSIYSEIKHLIEPLEGRVKLLGSLCDNDLRKFYMKINILALPSTNKFEAFGMVQLEAMTFGVIPITSNLPGVREVVNKTGIGYLVQPGNIEDLTIKLIKSINEIRKHDYKRLSISSKMKEKFSNRIFCEKYYEIFN